MQGVLGWGVHLPYRRLDRGTIRAVAGTGGGTGTRTVAGHDEDTTTMAVEAARLALLASPAQVRALWFATTTPAYLDKTNASAIHAALGLARTTPAYDAVGSVRSALGALRAALAGPSPALALAADIRIGLPGGADEIAGGDAAVALLVGDESAGPVLAEVVAWASESEEFLDRWRLPGATTSSSWEERFGETRYGPLAAAALGAALAEAGIDPDAVDRLIVAGTHERAVTAAGRSSGVRADRIADRLADVIGNPGAAQPGLLLAAGLESAQPGQTLVLMTLADGADVVVLRTTAALAAYRPSRPVVAQLVAGAPIDYGRYLAWRGLLAVEPPRRPLPARPSAAAAARATPWKFGLVGSQALDGSVHLPPVAADPGRRALADVRGTVATFTVDRLAYSPSPPVVLAVVDFDGGGRLPVELTDLDETEVRIGLRVQMTFRRLFTAEGVHNYFWKARPVRGEAN